MAVKVSRENGEAGRAATKGTYPTGLGRGGGKLTPHVGDTLIRTAWMQQNTAGQSTSYRIWIKLYSCERSRVVLHVGGTV